MTKILTSTIVGLLITSLVLSSSGWAFADNPDDANPQGSGTSTPIQHVIVIFQENEAYDHYFGTYPNALNPPGEPVFTPLPNTPIPNNYISHPNLLTNNPNEYNPFRLDRSQEILCDEDNDYTAEQTAYDGGLVDKFVQETGVGEIDHGVINCGSNSNGNQTMGYYDGNSVTGLWNMAQHFAMSDNNYGTEFGATLLGHINLISGDTSGVTEDAVGGGSLIANIDAVTDDCGAAPVTQLPGKNLGDSLNDKNVSWGWFSAGFKPSTPYNPVTGAHAICKAKTARTATDNASSTAYGAHYDPFMYYNSTANPHHLPPASIAEIGHSGQANHQYDLSDFWISVDNNNLPSVTFLKAPKSETGHPNDSSVLDEQEFLANVTNTIAKSPYWSNTAIFITWDDSDGWYDHQFPPIVNHSNDPVNDFAQTCGGKQAGLGGAEDRCGHGPRIPVLVISPYAKANYISHNVTDQSSIMKFILDNWRLDFDDKKSFVNIAGSLDDMFDFGNHGSNPAICVDYKTGEIDPLSSCPKIELSGY
jgi:phospholipase C